MTFSLGVPSKRNFYGWRGKNDNFTVEDVEEDISAIKNIRFTFKYGISEGQISSLKRLSFNHGVI